MRKLLELCAETSEQIQVSELPIHQRLKKDNSLKKNIQQIEGALNVVAEVHRPETPQKAAKPLLKAVAWNLERGKQFDAIVYRLQHDPDFRDADLFFFTEVDWGMFRSGNLAVALELGKRLNFYTYFSPSYFNLTIGHGGERHLRGKNHHGLHGKAILSRWPLRNLRTGPMPNLTNKLRSVEARIGQKRSLFGDLAVGEDVITLGCIHLDAFSSPRTRALQMKNALKPCADSQRSLIAGDWNTNTIDSRSGRHVFLSLLKQLIVTGPRKTLQHHHPHPDLFFDRPLFDLLADLGFAYKDFNEDGIGTFDLLSHDRDVGAMARDQMPAWIVHLVDKIVHQSTDQ